MKSPSNLSELCEQEPRPSTIHGDTLTQLKVDRFDSVSSFLLALIIFSAIHVLVLVLLWMMNHAPQPIPTQTNIQPHGTTASLASLSIDFEQPATHEVEQLMTPSISTTLKLLPSLAETVASDNFPSGDANASIGDHGDSGPLPSGPGSSGLESLAPWERWEIAFQASSKTEYATQLDHFNIHLAAFGGGSNVIEIASELSTDPQRTVMSDPSSEKRLYFSWKTDNPLLSFDRRFLAEAGISTAGRNVVRLIPKELELKLLDLERQVCQQHGKSFPKDILKTRFTSHVTSMGYQFKVVEQRYRIANHQD